MGFYYAGRNSSGGRNFRISGVRYSTPAKGGAYAGKYSDRGGSSGGGGGGSSGGSSYSAPKSTGPLPVKSNPYKPGTANYAKAEAYSKAYAAGDVKGGVIQNPSKYTTSTGGGFSGFTGSTGSSYINAPYVPKTPSTFTLPGFTSQYLNVLKDTPGVTVKEEKMSTADQPPAGKWVEETYDVPVRGVIDYEPEYGTYFDEAGYLSKREELISNIYNKIYGQEEANIKKRFGKYDRGALKRQKLKAALTGGTGIAIKRKNPYEVKKQRELAMVNTNLEQLRKGLYGEQAPTGKFKSLIEEKKKEIDKIKSSSQQKYITGYNPVRGQIGTQTVTSKKWIPA